MYLIFSTNPLTSSQQIKEPLAWQDGQGKCTHFCIWYAYMLWLNSIFMPMWHATYIIYPVLDTRCSIYISCVRQAHGTGLSGEGVFLPQSRFKDKFISCHGIIFKNSDLGLKPSPVKVKGLGLKSQNLQLKTRFPICSWYTYHTCCN